MNNQEIKNILIKELGIEELPKEAQNEVVSKLGDVILKSLTVTIFENLSNDARGQFEEISSTRDNNLIQEFLEENVPDLQTLMEEEVRKTLQNFAANEGK